MFYKVSKGKFPWRGELSAKFQISQSQYYKWRDQLLVNGPKVFEYGGVDRTTERLQHENQKLKCIIGELTVEFKKASTNYKEGPKQAALDKWVNDYNTDYPHSSLGDKTPCEFEKMHLAKTP